LTGRLIVRLNFAAMPDASNVDKEQLKREIEADIQQKLSAALKPDGQKPDGQGEKGGDKGAADPKEGEKKKKPSKFQKKISQLAKSRPVQIAAAIVLVLLLIWVWRHAATHESTDDAYTTGHIHNIAARVNDTVLEVLVQDNQRVEAGQILLRLDPADYEVEVAQAQANYEKAKADYDRILPLKGDEAISQQDFDNAKAALAVNEAQLRNAKNQLSYCTIVAPAGGRVGRKQVEAGNRVTIGGALMAVVENTWVVANFKETQLAKIEVGQPVAIEVDAVPGHKFKGWVDSFSPGSGSTFALLPPDNATGNFTKIVQRVPVKISFDPDSLHGYEDRIVAGLSCEVSIDVGTRSERRKRPLGGQPPPGAQEP
jgi:membrane fusion protein (multidrug efflux system)